MPPKKAQSKKAEPETQKDENKTSKKDETKENERSQGTKRKIPSKSKPVEITTTTIRKSEYTYFLLEITPESTPDLDNITTSTYLHSPLKQFLGDNGAAIASNIDILKVVDRKAFVRVPTADAEAIRSALSTWTGGKEEKGVAWRIHGHGAWLDALDGMSKAKRLFTAGN